MRSLSVAQAKAQLSALLDAADRLVRPNVAPEPAFDLAELMATTQTKPLHEGEDATALIRDLRGGGERG